MTGIDSKLTARNLFKKAETFKPSFFSKADNLNHLRGCNISFSIQGEPNVTIQSNIFFGYELQSGQYGKSTLIIYSGDSDGNNKKEAGKLQIASPNKQVRFQVTKIAKPNVPAETIPILTGDRTILHASTKHQARPEPVEFLSEPKLDGPQPDHIGEAKDIELGGYWSSLLESNLNLFKGKSPVEIIITKNLRSREQTIFVTDLANITITGAKGSAPNTVTLQDSDSTLPKKYILVGQTERVRITPISQDSYQKIIQHQKTKEQERLAKVEEFRSRPLTLTVTDKSPLDLAVKLYNWIEDAELRGQKIKLEFTSAKSGRIGRDHTNIITLRGIREEGSYLTLNGNGVGLSPNAYNLPCFDECLGDTLTLTFLKERS